MRIGNTRYETGTRIVIKGITDKGDVDLNGKTGKLTYPFHHIEFGDVGVFLDSDTDGNKVKCNLRVGEFEVLREQ